jgi:hypothetical protein
MHDSCVLYMYSGALYYVEGSHVLLSPVDDGRNGGYSGDPGLEINKIKSVPPRHTFSHESVPQPKKKCAPLLDLQLTQLNNELISVN